MASLVCLALKGDAKALVSQQVEYEELQNDKAPDMIFEILDKEYKKADYEKGRRGVQEVRSDTSQTEPTNGGVPHGAPAGKAGAQKEGPWQ